MLTFLHINFITEFQTNEQFYKINKNQNKTDINKNEIKINTNITNC